MPWGLIFVANNGKISIKDISIRKGKAMKRIFRDLLCALLIAALISALVGCEDYEAENFTVLDSSLNEVELYDLIGKPIVLNFWATWCYYCKIEMPHFEAAAEKYTDVVFMMVNYTDGENETVESASAYIEEEGYTFPIYYDTSLQAANAYAVQAFPTTVFIDRDGRIIKTYEGSLSADRLEYYVDMIK